MVGETEQFLGGVPQNVVLVPGRAAVATHHTRRFRTPLALVP
jgi:hypothetical protein